MSETERAACEQKVEQEDAEAKATSCDGMNDAITGMISEDTTWRSGSLCIFDSLIVAEGATLTIEEGVVVKSIGRTSPFTGADLRPLTVEGTLRVMGTAGNSVVFTDQGDDGPMGDTNNDGGERVPYAGSWQGISFQPGSSGEIRFADIRYAYHGVWIDDSEVSVSDARIRDGINAISALPTDQPTFDGVEAEANSKNGLVRRSGTVHQDTIWSDSGLPYVLEGDITVAEGAALSIEAGILLKASGSLKVEGDLSVAGAMEAPVIFTDVADDAHGGDTNNDEAATVSGAGSWGGLQFNGSRASGTIDFAEIHFAGNGIAVDACSPEITNSLLKKNLMAISASGAGARPVITGSSIIENNGGASASGEAEIDARDNFWGASDGPGGEGPGMGNTVSVNVSYDPFLTTAPN